MSDLVSKCVLRLEVTGNKEVLGAEAMDGNSKARGQRLARDISVETFPSKLESPRDDWGMIPAHSREATPKLDVLDEQTEIGFFSGNPFVEITKGILHLYKEDILSSKDEALTLCLLAVPTSMTCHDLLGFTAPCHSEIAHIRVLRDRLPNQYMALLTFRTHPSAREFYETFNGAPFNSLEPDVLCRAVWVSKVECAQDDLPPPGHTELPICPVCLERMDESVDGVLTILCNHTFHSSCLDQWSDSTCPVCRCVQSPEQAETSECERCGKSESSAPSPDALWICLICGHVGCGRYQGGHAASHYRETGHCYALQLGSHRVWDYKGDNFVHRLLQNKADGKLVPAEGPIPESEQAQEKVDSVQLEFTYLLTSQLEEQRMYFEEKLVQFDYQASEETKSLRDRLSLIAEENKQLKSKLAVSQKEKSAVERRLAQQIAKLNTTLQALNDERHLGKALRSNQEQYHKRMTKLEGKLEELEATRKKQIDDLKEQLRDVMFYIDAKNTIDKSDLKEEIAEGSVTIADAPPPKTKNRRRKK
ncbi:PREDICTED: BRCA1-associated protein [Nicrophorus vespilloides]|uniref:BRCA1-associated protein n=1 Tax=Nicrophorus vespilloides TaxID=110193 RepID=A0ABM1MIW5_NICVS|nr:PREDICTED: BRCA1-associated protein [Nicrophorus vespilloides]